jgi:murein DD-endopeptidase MepM/ murein hydrolase activator NlpD
LFPTVVLAAYFGLSHIFQHTKTSRDPVTERPKTITVKDTVRRGETFFDIFKKNGFSLTDLVTIRDAAASVHRLRNVSRGQTYVITADHHNFINSLVYYINDEFFLKVRRTDDGFQAERCKIPYERRALTVVGSIEDNLVSALGEGKEPLLLALRLSDIFAWDIDFTSDLRKGDIYVIVVEGLYLNDEFKKFGEVLSAVFMNNDQKHTAYRFELAGKADYFDAEGKALRKTFLRAPLSFRRISSHFSHRRFHPILRTYRAHRGVDYAASTGTPVSATAAGTVTFAGRRGQYGNLITVQHHNHYVTYYGHLSRFARNIRSGIKVSQGDIIGYVGATGLATGPHLHYEMRLAGKFISPLTVSGTRVAAVPESLMAEFRNTVARMERILSAARARVPSRDL